MKTTVWKRLTGLSLTAVMLLGFCAGFGVAPVFSADVNVPRYDKVNVIINKDGDRDADTDALMAMIEAELEKMGFGKRQISKIKDDIKLDAVQRVTGGGGGGDAKKPDPVDLPVADLSKWVVADHYDSGHYGATTGNGWNGNTTADGNQFNANATLNYNAPKTWIDLFNSEAEGAAADWSGKEKTPGNLTAADYSNIKVTGKVFDLVGGILRPYFPHNQTAIPGTAAGSMNIRKLEEWIKNPDKYYGNNAPAALTLGVFDRHIFVQQPEDADGPQMDFVGYFNSRYLDYVFYPMDTDTTYTKYQFRDGKGDPVGKEIDLSTADKLVKFDVHGGEVNPHTLFGAGFLVNTGIKPDGDISGYVLMYVYPDIGATASNYNSKGKYYPPELALYKINSGVKAADFHRHGLGDVVSSSTTPVGSAIFHSPSQNTGTGPAITGTNSLMTYIDKVALYSNNADFTNNNITGSGTPATGKDTNWWVDMHIEIVIKKNKLTVYQIDENDKGKITYNEETKLPDNIEELDGCMFNFDLDSMEYNGFGPIVSYRAHGCNRATQFTYSNLEMSIIGGIDAEYEVKYNLNGGTGDTPATHTKKHDVPEKVKGIGTAYREDYEFVGWHPIEKDANELMVMYEEDDDYERNEDVELFAVWLPVPKDKLIDALLDNAGRDKFVPNAINFFIDLTNGNKSDRTDKTDPKLTEAVNWMLNNYGVVRYITDTKNAILTDSDGSAMTAPGQGKTFGYEAWLAIAQYICSNFPPCVEGINYYGDEVIVFGYSNKDPDFASMTSLAPATPTSIELNLTQEAVFFWDDAKGFTINSYGIDVGKGMKWKNMKAGMGNDDFNEKILPKLLNKGGMIALSNMPIFKETSKDPVIKAKNKKKEPDPDKAEIIRFAKVNKRPKDKIKYAVNYAIYRDDTGVTAGEWVLSEKTELKVASPSSMKHLKQDPEAKVPRYIVAIPDPKTKNKMPGELGWGVFCTHNDPHSGYNNDPHTGEVVDGHGIPGKGLTGVKPEKTVYLVKMAPKDWDGTAYTPASKQKKVTVQGEQKATKYKLKQIKEKKNKKANNAVTVFKSESIKLKKGDVIFIGAEKELDVFDKSKYINYSDALVMYNDAYTDFKKEYDKAVEDAREKAAESGDNKPFNANDLKEGTDYNPIKPVLDGYVIYVDTKGGLLPLFGLPEKQVTVWKSATGKKPATAKQINLKTAKP